MAENAPDHDMESSNSLQPRHDAKAAPAGVVTALLLEVRSGRGPALARLIDVIYPELRSLAVRQFQHERSGHVLQPTALVHEAYLRLVTHDAHNWQNRAHFFGAAAQVMRRILVDYARAQQAHKRIDPRQTIALDENVMAPEGDVVDLVALDLALDALEQLSPRQARVVQLRYFTGLSVPEIAEALGMTPRTVDRDWAAARAWLRLKLAS